MSQGRLLLNDESAKGDVLIDMGHPLLNRVIDGFIKVGGLGALHAAAHESYRFVVLEEGNKSSVDNMANKIGKEAVQWGLAAGVYSGLSYGMQEARGGVHDWKNAMVGGALTGVALSLTEGNPRHDRVICNAITGGALAVAAEFLRNLT